MKIGTWFGSVMAGIASVGMLAASALASPGFVSSTGSLLKVRSENVKTSPPGAPTEWRDCQLYLRVADPAAVAANGYRGYDGTPAGVDVTGTYRVADDTGGTFTHGPGCIPGMATDGTAQPSVAFCASLDVSRLQIKTGNGDDVVELESADPAGSVPGSIVSTIGTGAGTDTIHGGLGNDFIKGGNGNDVVYGHAGDDALIGGGNDDDLYGGSGNDTFSGGGGDDRVVASDDDAPDGKMKCGSGFDKAYFDSLDGDPADIKNCEWLTLFSGVP